MSLLDDLKEQPHRFNFYQVLRQMERETPDKPRIGDSSTLAEEVVVPVQDPYVAFPAADILALSETATGTPRLHTRFLGMFGPQGALPLHLTEEAHQWMSRDPAFARFVDILTTRFLQLFYRAWADAHPIGQSERPDEDRFLAFLASFEGIASPALREIGSLPDVAKIPFAGLVNIQVKTARGLEQFLRGHFGVDVEVHQWIGNWLTFEEQDVMRLGTSRAVIGVNAFLGRRLHSIADKIRLRIRCRNRQDYESFLPGQRNARHLAEAIFFFCGYRQDVEVELGLPAPLAPRICLGRQGQIGWTSWLPVRPGNLPDEDYFDARLTPTL